MKFRLLKVEQGWSPQCDSGPASPGEWGVLKVGCMNGGSYDERENKALPPTLSAPPELEVRVGDVLMARSNTSELVGAVGRVDRTQGRILLCDKLYRLTFNERRLLPAFAVYLLQSQTARRQIEREATGASSSMKNISIERVGDLQLPYPPVALQPVICAYLDSRTAQLDEVVRAKHRMLDLLREKRQAVVTCLVTRGLDLGARLRDSGIARLGRVPDRWAVERLKFSLSVLEQGWSPQCDNRPADEGEWGVLKVGCVNGDEFDAAEQKALPAEVEPEPRYEVRSGDILMSRGNTLELVGSAAVVRDVRPRLMLSDLLYRLRVRPEKADPEFVTLQLRTPFGRLQIERDATGTSPSMKKIGQETIRDLVVCLPPLAEQRAIVDRARRETAPLDGALARIEQQLAKLREYRQALITAAVTGRLDLQRKMAV